MLTLKQIKAERTTTINNPNLKKAAIEKRIAVLDALERLLAFNPTIEQVEREKEKARKIIDRCNNSYEYEKWATNNPSEAATADTRAKKHAIFKRSMGFQKHSRYLMCADAIISGKFNW